MPGGNGIGAKFCMFGFGIKLGGKFGGSPYGGAPPEFAFGAIPGGTPC